MKIAVFTDEVSQDLERATKFAIHFGLDGVELRSVWDKPIQHLSDQEAARVQTILGEHKLQVAAIASPVFKCELKDESAHREHLAYLRSCIRIAKQLGTNTIRVFTFWKRGPSEEVWDQIKNQFYPAVVIAEQKGVILGIENEASTYLATAEETKRFITEIDSPVVKVVWDPCNEIFASQGIVPFPDAYRMIAPWIIHIHAKDAKRNRATGETELNLLGEGEIDWKGQIGALLAAKYEGYLSLETHWRPQALPEDVINRPGGREFSESGEYASELCMKNLLSTIAQARREAN